MSKEKRKLKNYQQWLFGSDSDSDPDEFTGEEDSGQQETKDVMLSNESVRKKQKSTSVSVHDDVLLNSAVAEEDTTSARDLNHTLPEPKKVRAAGDVDKAVNTSGGGKNDDAPLYQCQASEQHPARHDLEVSLSTPGLTPTSSTWINEYRGVRDPLSGWVRPKSRSRRRVIRRQQSPLDMG